MKSGYKNLIVWQKGIQLVTKTYKLTETFPQSEMYGLTSQMRRSAVSIPSNIAEGSKRGTERDFRNFLTIAFGSTAELETQLEIAKNLKFGEGAIIEDMEKDLSEISKMLYVLIHTKDF